MSTSIRGLTADRVRHLAVHPMGRLLLVALVFAGAVWTNHSLNTMASTSDFREVFFKTDDGGQIFANLYGNGDHGVVLAHGAVFNKESWHDQAQSLVKHGYQVLAIDFRGYGKSLAGDQTSALHQDVLAAVRYLHAHGSKRVSIVAGSMGGGAAARTATRARRAEIDRLILLAPVPPNPEAIVANKSFFIVSRGDRLLAACKEQYERASKPKRLAVLEGRAHAQHIFKTDTGDVLFRHIVEFLSEQIPPG